MPVPEHKTRLAAGLDLAAAVETPLTLMPGDRALVPTGFAIALPEGYEGQVRPRRPDQYRYREHKSSHYNTSEAYWSPWPTDPSGHPGM